MIFNLARFCLSSELRVRVLFDSAFKDFPLSSHFRLSEKKIKFFLDSLGSNATMWYKNK